MALPGCAICSSLRMTRLLSLLRWGGIVALVLIGAGVLDFWSMCAWAVAGAIVGDGLSYQLALRCDLAQGKNTVTYPVVKRGKVRQYTFKRIGTAVLETKLGSLETVVVDRVRDDDERTTRIWFAPKLKHMLVKLEQFEKDDGVNIKLAIESLAFED